MQARLSGCATSGGAAALVGGQFGRSGHGVDADLLHARQPGHRVGGLCRDQHEPGTPGSEHGGDAGRRGADVDRHVGAAGLEHGKQRGDKVSAALYRHPDRHVRAHTTAPQQPGQCVAAPVEFGVGDRFVAGDQCRRVRVPGDLGREQRGDGGVRGVAGVGAVPPGGHVRRAAGLPGDRLGRLPGAVPRRRTAPGLQQPRLGAGEQLQPADAGLRPGQGIGEQVQVVRDHPGHGGLVEQVGRVFPDQAQVVVLGPRLPAEPLRRTRHHDHVEVALGRAVRALGDRAGEPAEVQIGHRGVVEAEHDLEQRSARGVAGRADRVDEGVHRGVRPGQRVDDGPLHLLDQARERHLAGDLGPQDQGVDDHAEQRFELGQAAVRRPGAHEQVLLTGVAVQQRREARVHGREQRHPVLPAERPQCAGQLGRDLDPRRRAAEAHDRRPRAIGRQRQDVGCAGQQGGPVVHVSLQHLAPHPLPLPQGVVRVLDGEVGKRRRLAGREGRVEGAQLGQQHRQRPAVVHEMVLHVDERVLACSVAQQQPARQRRRVQVERLAHRCGDGLVSALGRDVQDPQWRLHALDRPLRRDPVDRDERGPQDLVPAHDLVERGAQRFGVHLAVQRHRGLEVVGQVAR